MNQKRKDREDDETNEYEKDNIEKNKIVKQNQKRFKSSRYKNSNRPQSTSLSQDASKSSRSPASPLTSTSHSSKSEDESSTDDDSLSRSPPLTLKNLPASNTTNYFVTTSPSVNNQGQPITVCYNFRYHFYYRVIFLLLNVMKERNSLKTSYY